MPLVEYVSNCLKFCFQALRNVQAKVDTNMRGGRGRGGPRGSRSRGRGAR